MSTWVQLFLGVRRHFSKIAGDSDDNATILLRAADAPLYYVEKTLIAGIFRILMLVYLLKDIYLKFYRQYLRIKRLQNYCNVVPMSVL